MTEAVVRRCSVKKLFLKISQIHRKTPVPESLFNKVAGLPKNENFLPPDTCAYQGVRNVRFWEGLQLY